MAGAAPCAALACSTRPSPPLPPSQPRRPRPTSAAPLAGLLTLMLGAASTLDSRVEVISAACLTTTNAPSSSYGTCSSSSSRCCAAGGRWGAGVRGAGLWWDGRVGWRSGQEARRSQPKGPPLVQPGCSARLAGDQGPAAHRGLADDHGRHELAAQPGAAAGRHALLDDRHLLRGGGGKDVWCAPRSVGPAGHHPCRRAVNHCRQSGHNHAHSTHLAAPPAPTHLDVGVLGQLVGAGQARGAGAHNHHVHLRWGRGREVGC